LSWQDFNGLTLGSKYGIAEICLHFLMAATKEVVILMWLAALSSCLVVLWCGHVVLWRNLGLKKNKKAKQNGKSW